MSIEPQEPKLPTNIRIGRRIRAIRALRGMQQKELADITGISTQTLSRLEQGKTDFQFSTIEKIEKALNCTLILVPNEDI